MKITVFGSRYVGLVAEICQAEIGVCIGIDQNKIDNLNKGIVSIYEPSL